MGSILDMTRRRMVLSANYNGHREGERHPDRVMQIHDILCIQDGEWELCQDDARYILKKGDVIFLHAGRHHYGGPHNPGVKTMFVHLEQLPDDRFDIGDGNAGAAQRQLALPVVARAEEHSSFIPLFEKIIYTYWSSTPNKDTRISVLVDQLLLQMAESGLAAMPTYDSLIDQALYHIHMAPDRFFKIDELAGLLHMSPKSLTTRFKAVTRRTVHEYQLGLKLDMALMLIRDYPDRPYKDIARNMGFYDEFHFSRHFKRKFGRSPREYKKAMDR